MRAAVDASVAFERFSVERALGAGDDASPEGRDAIIEQLRPLFAAIPPSAMRMELMRTVSSRLALPESLTEQLLAGEGGRRPAAPVARTAREPDGGAGGGARNGGAARAAGLRLQDTERAFLSMCIAAPDEGARVLAELDLEEYLSSALLRRAAAHLRAGSLREPMADRPGEAESDAELAALLAELVVEAGREHAPAAMLEVQRLQLELGRLDRQIQRVRGREDAEVSRLAARRGEVKREFDRAYGRVLEETGARE
jgi:DNA primase